MASIFFWKLAQLSNSKLLLMRSWWKIWYESSNSKLALVSSYIVYASSWSCLWIVSFFSGKQESKEPFFLKSFHNRPLKSTEVGEEMLESSNSKLFLVTCYIALGCVFFFSKYHISETFIFVEWVFSGKKPKNIISCMQVLEVACGLRHSFFPANKSQKSPFSHNRPLISTEVGEEMFESSNSKLFWVTCYIAVGCVFFLK